MKILVDTSYINNSGGKILLESFITKILDLKIENDFYFIFDNRFSSELMKLLPRKNFVVIRSNIFNRFKIFISFNKKHNFNSIFCLNNLPPPFFIDKSEINVFIYFHNLFYIKLYYLSFLEKTKFLFKRLYIHIFNRSRYNWVVQNTSTKDLLVPLLRNNTVLILPFFTVYNFSSSKEKYYDYIYVANDAPQKNINLLLDVWEELSFQDCYPSLILTLSSNEDFNLLQRVQNLINNGIKIINIGFLPHLEILYYYTKTKALIFPSKFESLGLPIIEATIIGMPIIASNKPYVNDIIDTPYLFDPDSKSSILESVRSSYFIIDKLSHAKLKCENKILNLINTLYV